MSENVIEWHSSALQSSVSYFLVIFFQLTDWQSLIIQTESEVKGVTNRIRNTFEQWNRERGFNFPSGLNLQELATTCTFKTPQVAHLSVYFSSL